MSVVTDRFGPEHDHVSRGFSIHLLLPGSAQLPPNRVSYKARHGLVFRFVPVRLPDGRYRAYIVDQPSYRGRPDGANRVHRLRDQHGYYVCWDPEPRRADDLLKVMRVWAEATAVYIDTGQFGPR